MTPIFDIKKLLINKKAMPVLLLCLCVGVVITLISKNQTKTGTTKENIVVESYDNNESIELKLKNMLSEVKGVGEVDVMIIYASSDEKILAKDIDSQGNEKTVNKNESSKNEPYVTKTKSPDVKGVIIVAKGGGNLYIRNTLVDCISNTLDIPAYKVKILEMK